MTNTQVAGNAAPLEGQLNELIAHFDVLYRRLMVARPTTAVSEWRSRPRRFAWLRCWKKRHHHHERPGAWLKFGPQHREQHGRQAGQAWWNERAWTKTGASSRSP